MHKLTLVKIFLSLSVLLFVAKPFLGFTVFSRMHPPATKNIFVKAFTKCKLEDSENSIFRSASIHKQLTDPAEQFVLRFAFLLNIILPAIFFSGVNADNRMLRQVKLHLPRAVPVWLLNGTFII